MGEARELGFRYLFANYVSSIKCTGKIERMMQ
jgi:hypothetical protein